MFWKKNKQSSSVKPENFPHPFRFCDLYISDKYKQILFVPYGQADNGTYAEVDNLIIDNWPCNSKDLETNIEEALRRFSPKATWVKGKWPSYDNSKAKSKKSYEVDYVRLTLETDRSRSYGDGEVERIKVTAQPTPLDNTYHLTGTTHLLTRKLHKSFLTFLKLAQKLETIRY
jgi:hypothetical protein